MKVVENSALCLFEKLNEGKEKALEKRSIRSRSVKSNTSKVSTITESSVAARKRADVKGARQNLHSLSKKLN